MLYIYIFILAVRNCVYTSCTGTVTRAIIVIIYYIIYRIIALIYGVSGVEEETERDRERYSSISSH